MFPPFGMHGVYNNALAAMQNIIQILQGKRKGHVMMSLTKQLVMFLPRCLLIPATLTIYSKEHYHGLIMNGGDEVEIRK